MDIAAAITAAEVAEDLLNEGLFIPPPFFGFSTPPCNEARPK
jgi:hypothetical protein